MASPPELSHNDIVTRTAYAGDASLPTLSREIVFYMLGYRLHVTALARYHTLCYEVCI
jgi:hypothetical protein